MSTRYARGADILGFGLTDFVPYLGVVGKAVGSLTGGGGDDKEKGKSDATNQQLQQLIAQQQAQQAAASAQAAEKQQMMIYILFGAVALGGLYLFKKKK